MKMHLVLLSGIMLAMVLWTPAVQGQCPGPTVVCTWPDTTFYLQNSCSLLITRTSLSPQVISNGCSGASTHGCYPLSDSVQVGSVGYTFRPGSWRIWCDAYVVDHPEIPTDTCWFTITVLDTSKPQLVGGAPFDLFSTPLPGQCTAAVTYDVPEFDDNCFVETICIPPPDSPFPVGVTTVECSATDPAGNVGSVSFKVTVRNNNPPVVTCPRDTTIECGTSTSPDDLGRATATASCNVGVSITYEDSPAMLACGIAHRIDRTWKATDSSGVEATCVQRITIQDRTPPSITCPADIVVPSQTAQVVNFVASATDGCDDHPQITCTPPSGSTFQVGITTVKCIAEDCDNNRDSCSFSVAVAIPEPVDIKPGSCPNPLSVLDRGLVPVAVLGTSTFTASQINPSTVRLAGVAPVQWSLADVATPLSPYVGKTSCTDCNTKKDRIADLTLKFDAQALIDALRPITNGECRVVQLVGQLMNGTPFVGEDIVRMQGTLARLESGEGSPVHGSVELAPTSFMLDQSYPNPFNPTTQIRYSLPQSEHVRLVVYDMLGQTVKVLVDEGQSTGYHIVEWDATDENGSAVSSGIYLYRMSAGSFTDFKKMILMR